MTKRKSYLCHCGKYASSVNALAEHYRKEHPNDAAVCFDRVGTVGDAFADAGFKQLTEQVRVLKGELSKLHGQHMAAKQDMAKCLEVNKKCVDDYNTLRKAYLEAEMGLNMIARISKTTADAIMSLPKEDQNG